MLEAEPTEDHVVHLRYEDGTEADVDLGYLAYLGTVFEPLKDPQFFRCFRIYSDSQTIYWPRDPATPEGEEAEDVAFVQADLAPETLYAHARHRAATPT